MSYSNWEFVSPPVHEPENWSSSSSSSSSCDGVDHVESSYPAHQSIKVNYFSAASEDIISSAIFNDSDSLSAKDNSPISHHFEHDWIEPSTPIQNCLVVLSEDDAISSKSCLGNSGEETEHITSEKEVTELSGGETAAAFSLDMSPRLESIKNSSHTEQIYGVANKDTKNKHSLRSYLGRWLRETRTTTFCSIALAVTVLGLAFIGNGWQHVRVHCYKVCCQFYFKKKGISRMMYQFLQVKESSSSKKILTSKDKGKP